MIRRALQWLGIAHVLLDVENDEIIRAIRHRSAQTTMRVTVIGCVLAVVTMRIWFPEHEGAIITLAIVALFIGITYSLINFFHGVEQAEEELRERQTVEPSSTKRSFLALFLILYVVFALTDYLFDRVWPSNSDLVGFGVKSLIWSGILLFGETKKNKRVKRSS